MPWHEHNVELARRLYSLLDLTSLNDHDTEQGLIEFSKKAISPLGHVAAVCVYPRFAKLMSEIFLNTPVKTATVVNFPSGEASLDTVLVEVSQALQDQAQEIDIVFPYRRFLSGDKTSVSDFLSAVKAACGDKVLLKVILETGALPQLSDVAEASRLALQSGANFIKTSTGKIAQGATLEAAGVMLSVIKEFSETTGNTYGLKVSGGIKTPQIAVQYLSLAESIMSPAWVSVDTFRIGASQLADTLLHVLNTTG